MFGLIPGDKGTQITISRSQGCERPPQGIYKASKGSVSVQRAGVRLRLHSPLSANLHDNAYCIECYLYAMRSMSQHVNEVSGKSAKKD